MACLLPRHGAFGETRLLHCAATRRTKGLTNTMPSLRTRFFQSWFRLSRPMTLGVRAIVENHEGQVLFVRHTYTPGWYLPGGGVERGQTCIEAIRRELVEEGGVKLTAPPHLIGIYSNHASFKNDHVLLYHVRAGAWEQVTPSSKGEIAERVWTSPTAPPEGITPGNLARLNEVYNGAPPSPYWTPAKT